MGVSVCVAACGQVTRLLELRTGEGQTADPLSPASGCCAQWPPLHNPLSHVKHPTAAETYYQPKSSTHIHKGRYKSMSGWETR